MKGAKFIISLFLIFISCFSFSQKKDSPVFIETRPFQNTFQEKIFTQLKTEKVNPLAAFLSLDPTMSDEKYKRVAANFNLFCEKLKAKKQRKKEEKFLKYVFFKVHKKYLREYQLNSPLFKTFELGQYDCVSGTAIYALILHNLNIPYIIKETKFHVYLLTEADDRQVLFETTDPEDGFITALAKIEESEKKYQEDEGRNNNYYVFKSSINEAINLKELSALEYYNMGVASFNQKNIVSSLDFFEKALRLYKSPRIQEIFIRTLEVLEKEAYQSKSIGLANRYRYYSKIIQQ